MPRMATPLPLHEFIHQYREALIIRCEAKVRHRTTSPPTASSVSHGVPLFLEQLMVELRDGPSQTDDIKAGAALHGRDLLSHGYTASEVVHDYGDICQSVTDLAVELSNPISTENFRTLNRCLDDAIAGAVTQHAADQQQARQGASADLRYLLGVAIKAFEALQTGTIGVGGRTGAVCYRSLIDARALLDGPRS